MAANTSKLSSTTTIVAVKRQRQVLDNRITRSVDDNIFPTKSIMKRNSVIMKYNHSQILLMTIIIMISQYYVECMNEPCNICSNPTIQSKNNDTIVDMTDMIILGMGDMATCQELSELGNMGFFSDVLCLNMKQRIDIQVLCGCAERVGQRTPSGRSIVHSNSPSAVPSSSPTQPTLVQVTIASFGDARQGFSTAQKKTQPTISPSLAPSSSPSVTVTVAKRVPPPVGAQGRSQSLERPTADVVPEPKSSSSYSTNINSSLEHIQSVEFFKDASDLKDAILASSEGGQIKTTTKKRMKEENSKKNNKNNNNKNKNKEQTPDVVPEEEEEEEETASSKEVNKQKKEKDEKSNKETTPVAVPPKQKKPKKNKTEEEYDMVTVQGLIRRRKR